MSKVYARSLAGKEIVTVEGTVLGEVENLAVAYLNAGYRHVFSFAILILCLLFRPQGLFGRKENVR